MSDGLNRAQLMGNIGADPDLRFTQGGQPVLNFRMATTTSYLDKDNARQERTEWHDVVVWGKRGEGLAKILTKGEKVYVEGEIRTEQYEKDGEKRYRVKIHATNVLFGGGGGGGQGERREERAPQQDRRGGRPQPQRGDAWEPPRGQQPTSPADDLPY